MQISGVRVDEAEGTASAKASRQEQLDTLMNVEEARAAGVA